MSAYDQHFLMSTEEAMAYAVSYLKYFPADAALECREIGDGNINYVFRVSDKATGRSLVIKQADVLLRSSGRRLDTRHSRIEAQILAHYGRTAPEYVPALYDYNEAMCAIAMEDISAYRNMRKGLMDGETYPTFAADIADFMVCTLLPTTDLVADNKEKKQNVATYTNPELCDITERLVLAEPFGIHSENNAVTPGNENFVRETLYENHALRAQVGLLRDRFMNHSQALLHGDLHTGSIFANQKGIKVIDPEFAFYGPIGYDVGNVIGNLFFAWAYWVSRNDGEASVNYLRQAIADVWSCFEAAFCREYDRQVKFDLYREETFQQAYLSDVKADTLGYAGTEIIRRTVGSSKVPELDAMAPDAKRLSVEQALIDIGAALIMRRHEPLSGEALTGIMETNLNRYMSK